MSRIERGRILNKVNLLMKIQEGFGPFAATVEQLQRSLARQAQIVRDLKSAKKGDKVDVVNAELDALDQEGPS